MNDKFTEYMLLSVNKIKLEGLFSNTYKSYKLIKNEDLDYINDSINDKYRHLLVDLKNYIHEDNVDEWKNFILMISNVDLRVKTIYSKKILGKFLKLYNSLDNDSKISVLKKITIPIIRLMIVNDYYETNLLSDIISTFSEMTITYDDMDSLIYFIYKNNLFKEILNDTDLFIALSNYLNEYTCYFENFISHYKSNEIYNILVTRKTVLEIDKKLVEYIPYDEVELKSDIPLAFLSKYEYFKYWLLEKNYEPNLIELAKYMSIDVEFAIELVNRGYKINQKSSFSFFQNNVIEYAIVDKGQDIDIIKYCSETISDRLAKYLLEHNYNFGKKIRICSESFCKYFYDTNLKNDSLDKFIKNKLNIIDPYYHLTCFLVEIGDIIGISATEDEMFDILQYMYFAPHKDRGFQYVVREKKLDKALKVFKLIMPKWDIKKFIDFVSSYIINENICNIVLDNADKIDNDNVKYNLMRILIYGNRTFITSFDDVINYKNKRYEINKETIKFDSIDSLKNIILKELFNLDSYEAKKLIFEFHISKNLDNLIESIHNPKYIDMLKEYRLILKFISQIMSCNDKDILSKLANSINELYKTNNLVKLDRIWDLFKEIEEDIRYILGEEINEKIIDFDEMLVMKDEDIPKDIKNKKLFNKRKFSTKKDLSYKDSKFNKGTELDYIELTGIPFVMFGHVLNAFGNGGDIDLFKSNYIEGKPYICLSGISDNHYKLAEEGNKNNKNSPHLLFTKLPSKQFIMGSNFDLNSSGDDLDIKTIGNPNFQPIRYNISNTSSSLYNEYIYYREGLYPSAVLLKDPKPKEHELIAALYLGIPLVYINSKYYPKVLPSDRFKKDLELYDYYEKKYMSKRKKELEKDILEMKSIREFIENLYFNNSDNKEVVK